MARPGDIGAGEAAGVADGPAGREPSAGLDQRLAGLGPAQRALLEKRLGDRACSGHNLVAKSLVQRGITHVYGVPGQPTYDTFGACDRGGIRLIGTRHQHPAGLMAAAHNYMAGRQAAVTIVSAGVPAANAVSAAQVANDNGWPLVILAGGMPTSALDKGYFMSLDAAALYRPVTKRVMQVASTDQIPAAIAAALDTAESGRPGAVLVDLPEDILTGVASGAETPLTAGPARELEPDAVALQEVVAALLRARRPLLIIGKGARWSASPTLLRELVESLALPFVTGPMASGMVPDAHESCMNPVSWLAQSQADLVLVLGARLNWVFRYGEPIAADAAVIQVDIDPAEFARCEKLSLAVHADAGCFLRALLNHVEAPQRERARDARDPAWVAALRRQRALVEANRSALAGRDGARISPLRLAAEIRAALPADAVQVFDSNLTMAACQQMIPAQAPVARLTPGTGGCMGVGIPYAIAAKLVHPQRAVVAICGDFAFGLSVMEFETAVRHNIPVVIVVANNDGNGGSLRHKMHFPDDIIEPVTMFQPGLRYDRIVDILGGYGQHVERAGDIGPAIARAIASGRPACVNVATDPDAPFPRD